MFERFTDEGRRVVVYAQEESRLRGDAYIGTEHFLLGLTHASSTSKALIEAGFDAESARRHLEETSPAGSGSASGHIPFTAHAKQTLEEALQLSNRLHQQHLAPPHLLRALLAVRDGRGAGMLAALGIDVERLAARAEELAADSEPDAPQPGRGRSAGA